MESPCPAKAVLKILLKKGYNPIFFFMPPISVVSRYFHPVLPAQALKSGPIEVQINGIKYALFRDRDGKACAVLDECPHRKAPLSKGLVRADGRLACPYHGWNFNAEGQGQSPSQPQLKCDTESFQVVEKRGYLWIASREVPLSEFPEMDFEKDGYQQLCQFRTFFAAPVQAVVDNFFEDEHPPWVHSALAWDEKAVQDLQFDSENFDDHTWVRYRGKQRHSLLNYLSWFKGGDVFQNEWETYFTPIRGIFSMQWVDPKTAKRRPVTTKTVVFIIPRDEKSTWVHAFHFIRPEKRYLTMAKLLAPLIRWAVRREIQDDARFIPLMAHTPKDMQGMRLGKFDKPLVHNRKLMKRIYFGDSD
jgi:phenylpropionate dioxygenase-like ring-hydroxylating dioxygenase large terminal subunit